MMTSPSRRLHFVRTATLLGFLTLACLCLSQTSRAQGIPGWTLVWADEFTQADGTAPDPTKWGYDIGGSGWGNSELEYYTDRTNNARIENGRLVIEAKEESFGGNDYTSARLLTRNKWTWTYGRVEARIKVPRGQGIWPAFWMLGANIDSVGWPTCGEIDIMEYIGREPMKAYGTIHGPGYSGGNGVGSSHTFSGNVADDFHVFAVEWETNAIRWYVDGLQFFGATPASLGGSTWVFDHPHFIILNLAVGGNWPGYPDETTVFPQQLQVDYVRVYAGTNQVVPPPTGTNVLANPGFESGNLAPWIGYTAGGANNLGGYVESTNNTYYNGGNPGGAHVLTHSGAYTCKTYGDYYGSSTENFNGFFQEFPAEPGSIWMADGWALTHEDDLMSGNNHTWIEVSFRDPGDNVLALYKSSVLDPSTTTPGNWMHLPVTNEINVANNQIISTTSTLIAPEDATKINYRIVFQQPGFDNGAMYYDDLNLVQQSIAVPTSLSASLGDGNIDISFETRAGVDYQVAYKTNLTQPDWLPVETIPGDGSLKTVTYPASDPKRYFSVQSL